jgi:hypothetical protein
MIDVSWVDGGGRMHRAAAVLEDISPGGACLQLESPVEAGTEVTFPCPQGRLRGVVRYCTYREIGYFLGLQFDQENLWSRERFEPEHLLDLDKLIQPKAKTQ